MCLQMKQLQVKHFPKYKPMHHLQGNPIFDKIYISISINTFINRVNLLFLQGIYVSPFSLLSFKDLIQLSSVVIEVLIFEPLLPLSDAPKSNNCNFDTDFSIPLSLNQRVIVIISCDLELIYIFLSVVYSSSVLFLTPYLIRFITSNVDSTDFYIAPVIKTPLLLSSLISISLIYLLSKSLRLSLYNSM